ncbi:MAG: hypothetical protein U0840_01325 [Gemmataceae bacterium]
MRFPLLTFLILFAWVSATPAQSKLLGLLWEYQTPGGLPQAVVLEQTGRQHLLVALKAGGLAVLKLNGTARPTEVARVPIQQLGKLDVMHLTQRGQLLYLALGDLFAAKGAHAGLAVVDLSKPAMPKVLGLWVSPGPQNGSAVVVVEDNYAYLGAMSWGVEILDISVPRKPVHLATFQPNVNFPRPNPKKVQHPNARGLLLAGDRLFVAYDAGGIRVLDVKNRKAPREIGRYVNAKMGNKQQAYNDLALEGDLLYATTDYAGLEIINVKNPSAMYQVGWWNPWKAETLKNLWLNSPGHTNQIALDRKRKRAFVSAGDSELQVVDVSNPREPTLVRHYGEPKDGRGAWGVTLAEEVIYLSYIQAIVPFRGNWSGIVAVQSR